VKKSIIAVFVVLGLIVFSVPMAIATPYQVTMRLGSFNFSNGGEFQAEPNAALAYVLNNYSSETKDQGLTGTFQTFCLEYGEHFTPGDTYDVILSDSAVLGGVGTGGDPLSIGSAWLYHEFQNSGDFDGLVTYNYSNPGRNDSATSSAALFQQAIWMLEGEAMTIYPYSNSNPFIGAVETKFGSKAGAQADNTSIAVKVMNLYVEGHAGDTAYKIQDQMVCVPDASIMWLLGPAFIMLGLFGRKKAKEFV
jgi:hypothetical protein